MTKKDRISDRIKELKQNRKTFRSKITRIKNFIDSSKDGIDFTQLKLRNQKLSEAYTEFEKTQNELELLDTNYDENADIEIETEFYAISAKIHDILAKQDTINASCPVSNTSNLNSRDQETDVFLPKISLPTFSGNYEDWPGFFDQFTSSVRENTKLNNCKKLTYLRSCLKGEAARVIESLNNSEDNYEIAWSILEKRYDQPAIIVAKHIKAIFEQSNITKSNHKDLRQFLYKIESHYRALKVLKQPSADTLLIYLLTTKIDNETACKWKEHNTDDFPEMEKFFEFLHERCRILEPLESTKPNNTKQNKKPEQYTRYHQDTNQTRNPTNGTQQTYATQLSQVKIKCGICKGNHFTQNCEQLVNSDVNERTNLVKKYGLCFNCLRNNHSLNECKASKCKKCNNKHHTLLHFESDKQTTAPRSSNISSLQAIIESQTLLSTAVVNISDSRNNYQKCRILIDNGSQSNFMTESMSEKLNLEKTEVNFCVSGIQQLVMPVSHTVKTTIKSRYNNFCLNTNFLILPTLSEKLPSHYINTEHLKIPHNINLADPQFNKPGNVDVILGSAVFHKLLCVGKISLLNDDVALLKTQFGWMFSGEIHDKKPINTFSANLSTIMLHKQISKFWEIEENSSDKILSKDDIATETHYKLNTERETLSGRFIVKLPFKENINQLGESYSIALKRFYSLEKSLTKNQNLRNQYTNFLREYQELNHMNELKNPNKRDGYYLPHHAVIKSSSNTTKLRVVFDGSCATSTGISLNETLKVGPLLQEDLFSILVRFRSHLFVLTADIAKMYRQILLHPNDRKYQKILWRESPSEPIKTYQLNTVTYGTTPASFLAIKSLHQLADNESKSYPLASLIVKEDFYVDDLLTGTQTLKDAIKLRDDLIHLLSKGGFQIRQWLSNDRRLTSDLQNQSQDKHFCLSLDEVSKTLGIQWQPLNDTIIYSAQDTTETRVTKRTILSKIAQLFDPLGLLGPVIVKAKMIMQRLWQLNISWDETVPMEIYTAWNSFKNQLHIINDIQFPRKIIVEKIVHLELHGFCDASEKAYGACLYTRCINKVGQISVNLVCSKSRVAPLKALSLPRLELCAALLLIKLLNTIYKSLRRLNFERVILWSDSTIALTWIATSPHTLQTFVANRVAEIQNSNIPHKWRHVGSRDNPADIISRGCMPSELLNSTLWRSGPIWLCENESIWPCEKFQISEIPEKRKLACLNTNIVESSILTRFSSFNHAKRVLVLCIRFSYNCSHPKNKRMGNITTSELGDATDRIIRMVQRDSFPDFLLNKETNTKKCKSNLAFLNPFLDEKGIVRVGGRICYAELPYESKHPILLPHKNHLTNLIIREQHHNHFHSGPQLTLAAIRQKYWITNGRNAIRNVLRKCIKCFRLNPPVTEYVMGNLPRGRVTYTRPFSHTGIDYCGPFFVKEKIRRNRGKVKVYIAIFVCLATRAIHIEVVSDLTTEAFLAALRRFFARRGHSNDLYSDNAKNFVGAKNYLNEIYKLVNDHIDQNAVIDMLANKNINWHFTPPMAPHFGGLWEAAVKSFKHHFYRITNNTLLTYESLTTLCTEIEAILNSRPIIPLNSDPNELLILTPGHFLIGTSVTTIPENDYKNIPDNRLNLWQQTQKMKQHFWTRWHKEYLHELTVRRKWHNGTTRNIKIGELVLLREENLPPLEWRIGRITQVHPGKDNIVRVVTVKTSTGQYTRSVKKLSPLPIEEEEN